MAISEEKKVKIIADGRQAEASINQLTKAQRLLNAEFKKEKMGSDRWKELRDEVNNLNSRIRTAQSEISGLNDGMKIFGKSAKDIMAGIIGANLFESAIGGIKSFASAALSKSIEVEESFADIRKVTSLTDGQIKELDNTMKGFNTRTSQAELRAFAVEAGKIGRDSVAEITKFVKEADQLNVALGEDLGKEAITQIGRLSTIFKVSMLEIGSAINEIGANSAASESYQVDFLNRMAGVGPVANLAADELLGFSATLENNGQTAEVAGTALSTFFTKFIADVEKFGQIAGMQKGQLQEIFNSKGTNEAFKVFLENLNKSKTSSTDLARSLDDMGIDGARSVGVFLALAKNTEEVSKQQAIANKAIKEGTSLTEEFNKKNETLGARLDKLSKAMSDAFLEGSIGGGIGRLAGSIADLIAPTLTANEEFDKMIQLEKDMQYEMNVSFEALKETNLSQEARSLLIDQINSQYKEYLPYLLTEKSSLEDITKAQSEANKEFERKIFNQIYEKDLAEAMQKVIEAQKSITKSEVALAKMRQMSKGNGDDLATRERQKKQLESLIEINKNIATEERKKVEALKEQFAAAEKALGLQKKLATNTSPGNNSTDMPEDPKIAKARAKKEADQKARDIESLKKLILEYEQDVTKLKETNEVERAKLSIEFEYQAELTKIENLKVTEEEKTAAKVAALNLRNAQLEEIDRKQREKEEAEKEKQKAKDKKEADKENTKNQKEQEKQKKKLDQAQKDAVYNTGIELKNQAFALWEQEQSEKYNRLIANLDKQKEVELSNQNLTSDQKAQIEAKYERQKNDLLNRQAKKEKEVAIWKILTDTTVAAVSALKTDPSGILSAAIAAQGLIQAGVVAAKEVPQYYYGGKTPVKGSTDGKLYFADNVGSFSNGGGYSQPSLGLVGEKGAELVVPNWLYTSPAMANTMHALESMIYNARPFAQGGTTTTAQPIFNSNDDIKMFLAANMKLMDKINSSLNTGIQAKMYWGQNEQTEFEKFSNRRTKVEEISRL